MRLTSPRLIDWLMGLAVFSSMAFYLFPVTRWALAAAVLAAVVVLFIRQFPLAGTAVLTALQIAMVPLAIPSENPAPLVAMLIAVYMLGRHSQLAWGITAGATYLGALLLRDFSVATAGFMIVVLGGVFTFGVLVRQRFTRATHADRAARALAGADLSHHTARVVADERARIGGQALAVIRGSVEEMRRGAASTIPTLDEERILRISERGRTAITELRWLLGLLRTNPESSPPMPTKRSYGWVTDSGVAVVLVVLTFADLHLPGQPTVTPVGMILLLLLPLVVVLRRRFPVSGCLAAAVAVGAVSLSGNPLFVGFGVGSLATLSLVAWSIGVSGRPRHWLALGALIAVTTLPVVLTEPGNVPMTIALFAVPAFAGHEWNAHDHKRRRAELRTQTLQQEISRKLERAVRAEKLRLARELHDVTSHAVGVMILQASAAAALRETDPEAARAALRTVAAVGETALTELGQLFDVLEAGAIGGPGLATTHPESILVLVERMRGAGLHVEYHAPVGTRIFTDRGTHPSQAIAYRVVQEALTNVARHAPTSKVWIQHLETRDEIRVSITDDGALLQGSSSSVPGTGFGLAGLAERVRLAGGHFSATAPAVGGFRVSARIPADTTTLAKVQADSKTQRAEQT